MNRKLTGRQIQRAARFLQGRGELTGARLRALLYKRHGARGSVARIYETVRELTGTRTRPYGRARAALARRRRVAAESVERAVAVATVRTEGAASSVSALERERDAALARVALVEARYEADTARWMQEVDQLRTRLGEAGRVVTLIYGRDPRDVVRELEAKLAAAQRKILALESARSRD